MYLKQFIRYLSWFISISIAVSLFYGCGTFKKNPKSLNKEKIAEKKKQEKTQKKKKKKKEKVAKKKEPEERGIKIGKTTKAYLVANYGKPDKTFWSKDAEEILIYDKIKEIGRDVIIYLDNKGVVKNITSLPKK